MKYLHIEKKFPRRSFHVLTSGHVSLFCIDIVLHHVAPLKEYRDYVEARIQTM